MIHSSQLITIVKSLAAHCLVWEKWRYVMRTNYEVKDLVESMKGCVKVPDKDMELTSEDLKVLTDRYIESAKICKSNDDFYKFIMSSKEECITIMMYSPDWFRNMFWLIIKRSLECDTRSEVQIAHGFMKLGAMIGAPSVLKDAYRKDINKSF